MRFFANIGGDGKINPYFSPTVTPNAVGISNHVDTHHLNSTTQLYSDLVLLVDGLLGVT
jgi:hypothetical protein